jgi:hypothetical protein
VSLSCSSGAACGQPLASAHFLKTLARGSRILVDRTGMAHALTALNCDAQCRFMAQMRSAATSAIPPLLGDKRTLRSHLAGSINSVTSRADRRATLVRWRCRAPKSLADSFCCSGDLESALSSQTRIIPAYIPDPPSLRSAGFFRLRHSIGQKRACYGLSVLGSGGRLSGLMCDRQLQYSRALAR